jgi:hypothetical protein
MARLKFRRRFSNHRTWNIEQRTRNNYLASAESPPWDSTEMNAKYCVPTKQIMLKNKLQKILLTAAIGIFLISSAVMAEGILPSESGSGEKCTSPNGCGNYSLNDILLVAVNVSNWILGVVGSVALLFFIYGGFVFIFSSGNEQTVSKGKQILLNAVIGLVIVFASYIIIQFSMTLLGVKGAGTGAWSDLLKSIQTFR